jgi:hypothetical protein
MRASLHTQAGRVARRAPAGDARPVPWRSPSRGASGLRTCPLCRSAAIRTIRRTELDAALTRVALQCGECEAWRARDLGPRAVRALDRRLRRDHESMERLGLGIDATGSELPEAERWQLP